MIKSNSLTLWVCIQGAKQDAHLVGVWSKVPEPEGKEDGIHMGGWPGIEWTFTQSRGNGGNGKLITLRVTEQISQ